MVSDLSGKNFGNWVVLDTFHIDNKGNRLWLCECLCGTE